jgi:hypothetical protein
MRFALVDSNRSEAEKGLKGICPVCEQSVIAKCGEQLVHHWAHRSIKTCDSWWENETEWHRAWKNNFPLEWQEFIQHDEETGEKHIADVRTSNGIILEFQHSHINPEERISREKFYTNMIWIVDGTRLKRDYMRFKKGNFKVSNQGELLFTEFPYECFPKTWLGSSVPIVFDFHGNTSQTDKDILYCLFPNRINGYAVIRSLSRQDFISKMLYAQVLWDDEINIVGTHSGRISVEFKSTEEPKQFLICRPRYPNRHR